MNSYLENETESYPFQSLIETKDPTTEEDDFNTRIIKKFLEYDYPDDDF
jgi:hypothetical protein